jgi:hypothetical protein
MPQSFPVYISAVPLIYGIFSGRLLPTGIHDQLGSEFQKEILPLMNLAIYKISTKMGNSQTSPG